MIELQIIILIYLLAALVSYQQWHHIQVKDQDELFVSKFLQEALDMMARVWRQQTLRTDKALFSLIPKKVKEVSKTFMLFICNYIFCFNSQVQALN
jgi:hypothetical protein